MLEVLSREGTCCYLVGTPFWHGFQSSYYAKTENTNLLLLRTRGPWYEWVITFAKYVGFSNKFSRLQKEIDDQSSSIPFKGTNRKKSQISVRSEEHLKTTTVYLYETIVAFILRIIKVKIH